MIKNSLKYGGILGFVALVCTLIVSSIYVLVDPIIIERTIQKVQDNMNLIFQGISELEEYEDVTSNYGLENSETIDALYKVVLANGETNYVYEMSPEGRNDEILFLVAFDLDGGVVKIQYVQIRETKGRGDKITLDNYLNAIYSQNASNMDVDMITGATYSSRAMKESLEASSYHLVNEVL